MACRPIRNKQGQITGMTAANGERSELFDILANQKKLGPGRAYQIYTNLRIRKEFTDWFGEKWDTPSTQPTQQASSQSSIFTDKNGEPKIISGSGKLEVMNLKGEIRPLSDFTVAYQSMDPKVELELLDIASDVVVDSSRGARNLVNNLKETRILLNPTLVGNRLVDNGVLAKIMLTEAFPDMGRSPQSQALALQVYRMYQSNGFLAAMKFAKSQGKTLVPAGRLFFKMYDNWNDQVDQYDNVQVVGYRTKIKERLERHNVKWKEDSEALEIEDDTPIRIYGINRLQENPRDKLSAEAKAALVGIKYVDPNSLLQANVSMTVDKVYGILSESVVNSRNFPEMLAKLEYIAKYRPEALPVLQRLKEATTKEQAAIFSNFALIYKEFLLLQISRNETPQGPEFSVNMFNPNEGSIARRYRTLYNENSVERDSPNPRAFYKEDENNKLVPIPEKVRIAKAAYERMEKARNASPGNTVSRETSDALGEYLWTLGMQYGPTIESTQDALAMLFEVGTHINGVKIDGKAFLKQFTQPSLGGKGSKNIKYLLERATTLKENNIYTQETSMIRHIASFAPLFDAQQVGAFISGTNKQYWPVNQATMLDEIALEISTPFDGEEYLESLSDDPFYSPPGTYTNKSPLLSELSNNADYRNNHFKVETLDSVKEPGAVNDYDSQSDRVSLIVRLNAYANNDNKKFTKIAVPTEADRGVLHFLTHPRYDKLSNFKRQDIIKGFLVQDLVRKAQAEIQVSAAEKEKDYSKLIKDYHYKEFPNDREGNAFTLKMSQVQGQVDSQVDGLLDASDLILDYLNFNLSTDQMKLMDKYFETEIQKVEDFLEKSEKDVKQRILDNKISLAQEVHKEQSASPDFIKNFVFNDFVGRIEAVKLLRGGFTFAKNLSDFYKRMALLTTPGQKLFIKDKDSADPDYGMMPTYNELTVADFDFVDTDLAKKVANVIEKNLIKAGVSEERAQEISDKYRPGKGLEKTDGQGFISIDMYRGIQMGLGSWTVLDEQAYKNEKAGLGYVDNKGNARLIYPIKPYHEELTLRNGTRILSMNKNSYTVITRELADEFPMFDKMYNAFQEGIHVINPVSATKGSKIGIQDMAKIDALDVSNPMKMDSTKLRLPQIIPRKKKGKILVSRQVRKNSIANVIRDAVYENEMTGQQIFDFYSNAIADNIEEDTNILEKELGITALRNADLGTQEYADARYNYLQKVRKKLSDQIKDKELPDNYTKALDIVPDGPYNWRFRAPLSFPNYQAKFEQIFLSVFKNGIFNQYIRGRELVQIAEAGGHGVDSELRMYDGTNRAQVRIKRSMLGLSSDVRIEDVDSALLEAIGYRVPHQSKNSSLPVKVVGFLPESHEKAIMVPGGVTKQQGSDFDIDKMYIIQPEVEKVDGKLQKIDPAYNESNPTRKQRDARIYDMLDTILTSIHHFEEVISPLDNPILEDLAFGNEEKGHPGLAITSVQYSYNHPLVEISMERRNKIGQRQTGTWANFIAGHNVLSVNPLSINIPFEINGRVYSTVGAVKDINKNFVDHNMSYYLNAAVDAGTKPLHVDINDNYMTAAVAGMMLSAGVPVEDVVYFVAQPIIKRAVEIAQNEEMSILKALKKVAGMYGGNVKKLGEVVHPMSSEVLVADAVTDLNELEKGSPELKRQLEYLDTFAALLPQGQHLQQLNQLLTPDTLENVNEMSSLIAYNDNRQDFLDNPDILIEGAKTLLEGDLYPISKAYDTIRQTALNAAEEVGFINNRPAFYSFKEDLKASLGKTKLTAAQHKFIDKALFLKIMASPKSPLANYMSQEAFETMYTNPVNNIGTKLENIKKEFPKLAQNAFIQKLKPSKSNHDSGQTIFTIEFDTSYDMISADKNRFSNSLLELVQNPSKYANDPTDSAEVEEILKFGKMLVSNQLLSKGFSPGPGAYIDLIPIEFFDTRILSANASPLTPMEFFQQEQKNTNFADYFAGFELEFVRNFGTARPGGIPLLKVQRLNKDQKNQSTVDIKNSNITTAGSIPQYFVTYLPTGPKIFVLDESNEEYSKYKELQPLGMQYKVHEVLSNRSNAPSLVNVMDRNRITQRPGVIQNPASARRSDARAAVVFNRSVTMPESVEQPLRICRR
jgi:hypothetical protein